MTTNGAPSLPRPWNLPSPRRVLLWLGIFALLTMVGGGIYTYHHRHDTICRDRKPPLKQQDTGIGQVQYLCHDGQIVTKP